MNNLCALLFVYCGLLVIKIKSAEGISHAHVLSLYVFFSHSLSHTLSWLPFKPSEPFGPSHPPLARAEINCWLKKCLATPSLWSKNTSTGCHLWYQAGYLLGIIRADTTKWYSARGICMTSLSMPCWRKSYPVQWVLYASLRIETWY